MVDQKKKKGKKKKNHEYSTDRIPEAVFKDIADRVRPGEKIAEIYTVFGDLIEQIFAPDCETVVIGVEGNPVAKTGNRVVRIEPHSCKGRLTGDDRSI